MRRIGITVIGLLGAAVSHTAAQELWPGLQPSNFRFDISKPYFEGDGIGFFSLAMVPAFRFPAGPVRVNVDLPFAFYNAEGEQSDARFGNPYLGLELGKADGSFTFQVGARVPLADYGDDGSALYLGMLSDWDHTEAWVPDQIPVGANVLYQRASQGGFLVSARVGATALFFIGDASESDPDVLANYGLRLGYEKKQVMLGAALTGRWVLTSDDDDTSQHQFGLEGGYRFGSVMPMLSLRLPIDEPLTNGVKTIWGIGLRAWW
jgi:hypothetical protein